MSDERQPEALFEAFLVLARTGEAAALAPLAGRMRALSEVDGSVRVDFMYHVMAGVTGVRSRRADGPAHLDTALDLFDRHGLGGHAMCVEAAILSTLTLIRPHETRAKYVALVDRLDGYALPGFPLKAIGTGGGELVVQTPDGPFSSADVLSWRPGAPKVVAWSIPTPLAASDREAYARRLAPAISLQRILLDLHSGRFLGRFGPLFFDVVAIFLTILALSGAWMFLAPRLRR